MGLKGERVIAILATTSYVSYVPHARIVFGKMVQKELLTGCFPQRPGSPDEMQFESLSESYGQISEPSECRYQRVGNGPPF